MTNIRKNKIYGNWTVLSIHGEEIFKCLEERAEWYLKRNLAVKVLDSPHTVKLNFEVKKEGNKGDAYYLSSKKNICVKCGTDDLDVLTKHHIVPRMYRKFFPIHIKSRNSFDVVPICLEHHEEYERHADYLKEHLAKEYNAPINGIFTSQNKTIKDGMKAGSFARAIISYGDKMSEEKKRIALNFIKTFLNKADVSDEDIKVTALINMRSENKIKSHGEIVTSKIINFQEFVEMWRLHFLNHMEPKFMPDHWDYKRPINR